MARYEIKWKKWNPFNNRKRGVEMEGIQIQSWLMLIITVAYVVITFFMLRATILNTQEILRPRIYLDFIFDTSQGMYAIIKNYGKKAACNIEITIDPDFKYGNDESLNNAPYIKSLPFLAPENERRSRLGNAPELFEKNKSNNILKVSVRYADEISKQKYYTFYNISLDSFRVRFVKE